MIFEECTPGKVVKVRSGKTTRLYFVIKSRSRVQYWDTEYEEIIIVTYTDTGSGMMTVQPDSLEELDEEDKQKAFLQML